MAQLARRAVPIFFIAGLFAMPARGAAQTVVGAEAVLSDDRPVAAGNSSRPVDFVVDFGTSFSSIAAISFSFVFSADDPLDPGECLLVSGDYPGGGFCNISADDQLERIVTFPCSSNPDVCAAYLDGDDAGLITVSNDRHNPTGKPIGRASVTIESLTVIVSGT